MSYQTFEDGYKYAIHKLEEVLDKSIRRNGGATTAPQCVNVLNEVILHVHRNKEALKEPVETVVYNHNDVEDVFKAIFGENIQIRVMQGGVH